MGEGKMIAVAGKGGVGKTSISATIVRLLAERYPGSRILAIDADPAVGLATALGIEAESTLDDIRKNIIADVEKGATGEAIEMLGEAKSRLIDAMVEMGGFVFLAVGRPETAGCYCTINAYLKEVISLLAKQFDYVVVDGEAGIEQINRRVMEKVTHLILVTDSSKKGTQVIRTIRRVAEELVMYEELGVIANRLPKMEMAAGLDLEGLPLLSCIGVDESLTEFDFKGENVFCLPEDSLLVAGVRQALEKMDLV